MNIKSPESWLDKTEARWPAEGDCSEFHLSVQYGRLPHLIYTQPHSTRLSDLHITEAYTIVCLLTLESPFHSRTLSSYSSSSQKLLPLQPVRSLILQPLTIALHASNLFSVVVRDRVAHTLRARVDTVLLDPGQEFLLTLYTHPMSACISCAPIKPYWSFEMDARTHLCNLLSIPALHNVECRTTYRRSHQPSCRTAGNRGQSHHNQRIHPHDRLCDINFPVAKHGQASACAQCGGADAGDEVVAAAQTAETKEGIPI